MRLVRMTVPNESWGWIMSYEASTASGNRDPAHWGTRTRHAHRDEAECDGTEVRVQMCGPGEGMRVK